MKNKSLFIIVFAAIMSFYLVNAAIESKYSAKFIVDSCTSGFVNDLACYYEAIHSFAATGALPKVNVRGNFPPLYQFESAIIINLFGRSWPLMNALHNGFYLSLLILFTYLLGSIVSDERTGLITAIIISLYPLTYSAFDKFSIDFPLMAIITMNIYLLLKSDYLFETRWSILAAFALTYGMLMKEPYGAFIIGPVIFVCLKAIHAAVRGKNYKRLINLVILGVIVYSVLFIITDYYAYNLQWKVFKRLLEEPSGGWLLSAWNVKLFTSGLWDRLLSPPFFIVLIFSFLYFFKHVRYDTGAVILLWIAIPNIIVFLMPHWKTARYLLPELPAFALISATGLNALYPKKIGKLILAFVILVGIGQYYVFKYDIVNTAVLNYRGFEYFHTENELNTSIAGNKKVSNNLQETAKAVVAALYKEYGNNLYGRSYHMLFTNYDGEWSNGFQFILGPYLWFAHGMDVDVMKSHEVFDALITGDPIAENIDFIVYTVPVRYGAAPLTFSQVKDNWINVRTKICPDPEYDKKKNCDWDSVRNKWEQYIKSFRYCGIVARDDVFTTYLYARDIHFAK